MSDRYHGYYADQRQGQIIEFSDESKIIKYHWGWGWFQLVGMGQLEYHFFHDTGNAPNSFLHCRCEGPQLYCKLASRVWSCQHWLDQWRIRKWLYFWRALKVLRSAMLIVDVNGQLSMHLQSHPTTWRDLLPTSSGHSLKDHGSRQTSRLEESGFELRVCHLNTMTLFQWIIVKRGLSSHLWKSLSSKTFYQWHCHGISQSTNIKIGESQLFFFGLRPDPHFTLVTLAQI